jgi:hypothetical protein
MKVWPRRMPSWRIRWLTYPLVSNSSRYIIHLKMSYCNANASDPLPRTIINIHAKVPDCLSDMVNQIMQSTETLLCIVLYVQDDLTLPETDGGEQHMLMLTSADHSVKEPSTYDIDKQEASTGNVPGDAVVGASKASTGEGTVIEKRKCSMRVCKPQTTFAWPDTSAGMATGEACSPKALPEPLTPGGDLIVTNFDSVIYNLAPSSMEEYLATDGLPTPTSVSSTTTASTKLPLLPTPASPIQQLSTATSRDDEPCSRGLNTQLSHKVSSPRSSPWSCSTKLESDDIGPSPLLSGSRPCRLRHQHRAC